MKFIEVAKHHLRGGHHGIALKTLVRVADATDDLVEVVFTEPLVALVEVHHGIDEQRHAAHDAIARMRCACLHEARLNEDDLCAEVFCRPKFRHQMVGDDNHAVALLHPDLLSAVFHHTFAVGYKHVREVVPQLKVEECL